MGCSGCLDCDIVLGATFFRSANVDMMGDSAWKNCHGLRSIPRS